MAELPAALFEPDRHLLVVDDDELFLRRISRALNKKGFIVDTATSVEVGCEKALRKKPAFAVVDLRLSDGNGLLIIETLRAARPDARCIVLTGYGAIAAAVAAVKMGATDFITKPSGAEEITAALLNEATANPPALEEPMSPDRVRWEYIHRAYEANARNISKTARRLGMHRRTLQRILSKRSPP